VQGRHPGGHVPSVGQSQADRFPAARAADDDGDLPEATDGGPTREDEIGPDDVALVLFTSGTTGTSKAVLHTANTLHASTCGTLGALVREDPGPDPRVMTPSVATHARPGSIPHRRALGRRIMMRRFGDAMMR
jgi:acyl-CoA synthetase (AMP-forming)/AMP-acid ligase II